MRILALIGLCVVGLTFVSCGDESTGTSGTAGRNDRVTEVAGPASKLKIRIPARPPPKELVVRNIRPGSGSGVAKAGDEVVVNYVGVEYDTGHLIYDTWEQRGPSHFHLKAMRTGWELGLNGMTVGGRRELIVPSRLAYHTGALIYLVDLLRVRPWTS